MDSLAGEHFKHKDQRSKASLVEEMNNKLLTEYLANIRTLERSAEQYLSCNVPFQLLHLASNKFLASSDSESNSEKENRCLRLDLFPSNNTLFSLDPIYKHQSDRDNLVFFGEDFYILSHTRYLKEKLYLHVSPINLENLMLEEINKSKTRRRGIKKVCLAEQFEVNLSTNEKHKFAFEKFDSLAAFQEQSLSYGNLVWLNMIESDATLVAQPTDRSEKSFSLHFQSLHEVAAAQPAARSAVRRPVAAREPGCRRGGSLGLSRASSSGGLRCDSNTTSPASTSRCGSRPSRTARV